MSRVTAQPVDHFRKVMGHFPTGVVVVAAQDAAGRHALTLQSFQSLSLDPALALIPVAHSSTSWPKVESIGSFAVSILAADQGSLARQFSRKDGGDKFEGVAVHESPDLGHPILSNAAAWVECKVKDIVNGGDHHVVIANVLDLGLLDRATDPLLFFASRFANLTEGN